MIYVNVEMLVQFLKNTLGGPKKPFWPVSALFSFPDPPKFSGVWGFRGSRFPEGREVSACAQGLEHRAGEGGHRPVGRPELPDLPMGSGVG